MVHACEWVIVAEQWTWNSLGSSNANWILPTTCFIFLYSILAIAVDYDSHVNLNCLFSANIGILALIVLIKKKCSNEFLTNSLTQLATITYNFTENLELTCTLLLAAQSDSRCY